MDSVLTATHRVLVIDDDPGFGRMAYRYLQNHGFEAYHAATGTNGQAQIEAFKPELILLDIHLPDIDGIALYRAFKIDPRTRDIPIILITAEVYLDSLLDAAVKGLGAEPVYFKGNADMRGLMERIRKTFEIPRRNTEPATAVKVSDKDILVIDDDPEIQDLVRLTLERRYPRLQFCDRGQEGFRLALEHRPDLILLDMMMPGLSGMGVYDLLQNHPQTRDIPVLVMTGMTEGVDVVKDAATMMGVSGFVRKPFDGDEFLRHVDRLVQRGPTHLPAILERGRVRLDTMQRAVWVKGRLACRQLGPKRFELLCMLLQHERAVRREDLRDAIWSGKEELRTVDKTVSRLRQDLGIKEGEVIIADTGTYLLVG